MQPDRIWYDPQQRATHVTKLVDRAFYPGAKEPIINGDGSVEFDRTIEIRRGEWPKEAA